MLFELIGVLIAGVAGAGAMSLLRRIWTRPPRWLVPVAAAATMMTAAVSLEYSWYDRMQAGLPEGFEVALTHDVRAAWKPWTLLAPYTDRFLAVDRGGAMTNPGQPGLKLVDIYAFGRWTPVRSRPAAVDCAGGRRAEITPDTTLGSDGALGGFAWRATGAEDPIVRAACGSA